MLKSNKRRYLGLKWNDAGMVGGVLGCGFDGFLRTGVW